MAYKQDYSFHYVFGTFVVIILAIIIGMPVMAYRQHVAWHEFEAKCLAKGGSPYDHYYHTGVKPRIRHSDFICFKRSILLEDL